MNKYLLRTLAACAGIALFQSPARATIAPATRNLLTTEFYANVPSVTLRGSQISAVTTSILPFENVAYYQTIGGFSIASVRAVVGSAYDSAVCSVSSAHAVCTDTASGSNAAIDILGDPNSESPSNFRTFKVSYQARDPRANGYIFNPVRVLVLAVVFADNGTPRNFIQQYVFWTPHL